LTRVVVATVGACGVILIAAATVHLARSKDENAFAATSVTPAASVAAPTSPAPSTAAAPAVPVAPTTPPSPAEPQSGTLTLQRPAVAGHVWLDGQKLSATSATITCGKHQIKVGAHGRAHPVDVPCGGELRISR
jgi:hypothetical protein